MTPAYRLVAISLFAAACGGSPPTPTAATPTPTPAPPTPPAPLTAPVLSISTMERGPGDPVPVNFAELAVTISWAPIAGATSYLLEVGRQAGTDDVVSRTLTTNSLSTTLFTASLPTSGLFVYPRVTARDDSGAGQPSAANIIMRLISLQDYVDALFLGTGPLAQGAPFTGCTASGVMAGWPAGTSVTVTLSSSVSASLLPTAEAWARDAREATTGAITATARTSSDPHPTPSTGEIVVEQSDAPCGDRNNTGGCFQPRVRSAGVYSSGRIQFRSATGPLAHELGHALGFCHTGGWAGLVSMMGGGVVPPTSGMAEADIIATRQVYTAGLRPGAARSQFVGAGLIRP